MKGIKECVSAIVDGKTLLCTKDGRKKGGMLGDKIRLVEREEGDVEIKTDSYTPDGGYNLSIFTEGTEWEEVIQPVDFLTAHNDCKETGQKYKGQKWEQDRMGKDGEGKVFVYTKDEESNGICTEQKWVKYD